MEGLTNTNNILIYAFDNYDDNPSTIDTVTKAVLALLFVTGPGIFILAATLISDVVNSLFESIHSPTPEKKQDKGITIAPATYKANVHGENGSKLRQELYQELLKTYKQDLGFNLGEELSVLKSKTKLTQEEALLKEVLTLLDHEKNYSEETYLKFTQKTRDLISYCKENEGVNPGVVALSRKIAYAFMTPSIQAFQEKLVQSYLGEDAPEMTADNFHEVLPARNKAVGKADSKMKMGFFSSNLAKAVGGLSLGNYFDSNPPNLRKVETWKSETEEREIYHMRHATPHVGAPFNAAPIDPIYEAFLEEAKERGEGVLYACHQRLGDKGLRLEQEGYRADSIVALEEKHPNLLVLFQSVENDLFKKGATTFAELKEQLIATFEDKASNTQNRLPSCLMENGQINEKYRKKMEEILNFVHETFFDKRTKVDLTGEDLYGGLDDSHHTNEAQAFIMLFYHFQREHLKFADKTDYEVKYVNTGCKDDFDRGGAQNIASDRVDQTILYGNKVPQEALEATASSVQEPPIHAKGIPVINHRMQPSLFVSRLLATLSKDQIDKLQARKWGGFSLTGYTAGPNVSLNKQ